jgi:hypothetical protein
VLRSVLSKHNSQTQIYRGYFTENQGSTVDSIERLDHNTYLPACFSAYRDIIFTNYRSAKQCKSQFNLHKNVGSSHAHPGVSIIDYLLIADCVKINGSVFDY